MPDWRYRGRNVLADMRRQSSLINIQPYRSSRMSARKSRRVSVILIDYPLPPRKKHEGCEECKRASDDVKEDDYHLRQLPTMDEFCNFAFRAG